MVHGGLTWVKVLAVLMTCEAGQHQQLQLSCPKLALQITDHHHKGSHLKQNGTYNQHDV